MHTEYTDCIDYTLVTVSAEDDAGFVTSSGLRYYLHAFMELHGMCPMKLVARIFAHGEMLGYTELVDTSFMRLDHAASEVLPPEVYAEASNIIYQMEDERYKFLN